LDIHYLGTEMKKVFALVFSLTIALAASLGCASANAAQTNANVASLAKAAAQTASKTAQPPHSLTRREVYDQLLKAEKDGSLDRLNATVYLGA
jgi:hypothetical protein